MSPLDSVESTRELESTRVHSSRLESTRVEVLINHCWTSPKSLLNRLLLYGRVHWLVIVGYRTKSGAP